MRVTKLFYRFCYGDSSFVPCEPLSRFAVKCPMCKTDKCQTDTVVFHIKLIPQKIGLHLAGYIFHLPPKGDRRKVVGLLGIGDAEAYGRRGHIRVKFALSNIARRRYGQPAISGGFVVVRFRRYP